MSTEARMMPKSAESAEHASYEVGAAQRFWWSLRRELWESRWIYLAPLVVAALFLIGFAIGLRNLPAEMQAALPLDPAKQRSALAGPYDFVAGLLMATQIVVSVFYCVDALYGERRDRSILFWKSLPVSDGITMLAKACVPLVIIPVVTVIATFLTMLIMLAAGSAVLAASGQSVAVLWTQVGLFRTSFLILYHMVTVHALWQAPFFGWFFFVSAWAPRAPFIWAFLPPIAVAYLEKIAFHSTHFVSLLQHRLAGNGMEALTTSGAFPTEPGIHLTPIRFVLAPGLWIGFAITFAFLFAAVRLRRSRGAI
jgi:ABC-2 type transport system permease protein